MGCYNETCAISNVHITYKDDVAVVLLQGDDRSYESYCYTNAYVDVAPLMFYGRYNDYGSVEDVKETLPLAILLENIKENLVEDIGDGDNDPISRADFNLDCLLDLCRDRRLAIAGYPKGKPVRYAFIHKTVFDTILAEHTVDGFGTDCHGNFRKYTYTFATMAKDIPEYVRRMRLKLEEISQHNELTSVMWKISQKQAFDLFEGNEINLAAKHMRFENNEASRESIFSPIGFLCEHGVNLNNEELTEFVTELLKMQWLKTNKVWIKPMSAGQEHDWRSFEILNKAVAKVISDSKEEFNEEEEEEEVDVAEPYSISLEERPEFYKTLVKDGY